MNEFGKHAAETDADHQRILPRLDVNIAGTGPNGVGHDVIDEHSDLDALLGGVIGLEVLSGLVQGMFSVAKSVALSQLARRGCFSQRELSCNFHATAVP
jgi:hypothetical protein